MVQICLGNPVVRRMTKMGITRQYLRWTQQSVFGCVGSPNAGIVFIASPKYGPTERLVVTAVGEFAVLWDAKTGEKLIQFSDDNCKSEVTCLVANNASAILASGHADGSIRLFDLNSGLLKVTFNGHKTAVTALCFDGDGLRLASGGKDTEIVIWDVTNESGLYRLKGHKGAVTHLQFMAKHPILVSSSKDTYIKLWDLTTQHCFKTLLGHRSEVWSFVLINEDRRLISGASDSELRVWNITFKDDNSEDFAKKLEKMRIDAAEDDEEELEEETDVVIVERYGTIMRRSTERLSNICVDPQHRVLLCHAKDSFIECFKLRNEEEVKKSINSRLKKERKRRKSQKKAETETEVADSDLFVKKTLSDEIEKLDDIKTSSKVKGCDVLILKNECKVSALLADNSVELFSFKPSLPSHLYANIRLLGHRTDVRTVSFTSDNYSIASASAESVKIWNRSSNKCITTITDGVEYTLCSVFAPGDRFLITGTKTGRLQIFDTMSAQLIRNLDASEDLLPIWSICLFHNNQGLVSGSEDKMVRFWSFDMRLNPESNSRQLSLKHQRTLKMDEGVLCVRVSPNGKFIAASLLDSTVKIFFFDTLKFFVSLYGHKFPVLTMDISSDSTLIATGSSDKNIKIWGMDFGDCHKSIFAHDDNIMAVQFVPKTHYFFSASKDKTIKEWDADHFEKILTLTGHQAEVWALAISPDGKHLVTASHDKSLRLWSKTAEPLVLEEEKEIEREKQFEDSLFANEETVIAGETNKETTLASKKTIETLKGAEMVIEALDIHLEEVVKIKTYELQCQALQKKKKKKKDLPPKPAVNPMIMVHKTDCPHRYVLEVLKKIKSNELEETLLTLPFNYIIILLKTMADLLDRHWETELLCRCVCFILRVNFGQISSTPSLLPTLDRLRKSMNDSVTEIRDIVGLNSTALQYFKTSLDSSEEVSLFREAFDKRQDQKKKRSRSLALSSAPIMSWN